MDLLVLGFIFLESFLKKDIQLIKAFFVLQSEFIKITLIAFGDDEETARKYWQMRLGKNANDEKLISFDGLYFKLKLFFKLNFWKNF
jgi:hypothetical protein